MEYLHTCSANFGVTFVLWLEFSPLKHGLRTQNDTNSWNDSDVTVAVTSPSFFIRNFFALA